MSERPKITRRIIRYETIEVPEGKKPCRICHGQSMQSKYDDGWQSVHHDLSLAAPRLCYWCKGTGMEDE